ncbi:uncharacterized protein FOMMEDRAFT_131157 [Fomitiporia mediterranea MF3/22]|uniref:uncharacterized protein n=1 Tax=Fomitiporia mediterranea (strain MF3/22) TaxID=694068 RepID=UPI0004409B00|nr:uncharacterized protein FOMMEDRAFT_131157 [Fomitiporia mediterranea MF3/22]EJD08300.1 hypothetical protein FOMMEDRAFT_131157 [Fomitiporia mediterranea MF3/22]
MSHSPVTLSFASRIARVPRLSRMPSQRIVHAVQTDNSKDVSFVTLSEDGCIDKTRETVDVTLNDVNKEEVTLFIINSDNGADTGSPGSSIILSPDVEDGLINSFTCRVDEDSDVGRIRRASLFSNDEFEPIKMELPQRSPLTIRIPDYAIGVTGYTSPSPASDTATHSGHSSPSLSPSSEHSSTSYQQSVTPSSSCSTLFSAASSSSSSSGTFVDNSAYSKPYGYPSCDSVKDDCGPFPFTLEDGDSLDNVTDIRGFADLRSHGYDFGWSRFASRPETRYGLSAKDAAKVQAYLARGPNEFPRSYVEKVNARTNAFEKKLFRKVFKFVK